MIMFKGHSQQTPKLSLRMLLDSGADRVYIDRKVASQLGDVQKGHPIEVKLPNGATEASEAYVTALLQIDKYKFTVRAIVLDLSGYDVVLGLSWLRKVNPSIDWATSTILVRDHEGYHKLRPHRNQTEVERSEEDSELVSHRTMRSMLKDKRTETFLCVLRAEPVPASSIEDLPKDIPPRFMRIIQRFKDCFRAELPDKLPPKRGFEHVIDTGTARPINQNPYLLSPAQLEEQTTQVRDLLQKGLIRVSSSPWGFPVLFAKKPEG
jgi:hypothetical protein